MNRTRHVGPATVAIVLVVVAAVASAAAEAESDDQLVASTYCKGFKRCIFCSLNFVSERGTNFYTTRFGRSDPAMSRFGRAGMMRYGRAAGMMRYGRSSDPYSSQVRIGH